MSQDADLLPYLTRLLNGSLALDDFRHWFANALWDIESDGDPATIDLAYLVENRLAEFSGGHFDEARLRAVLADDLRQLTTPAPLVGLSS